MDSGDLPNCSAGAERIMAERNRQILDEGYDYRHDDSEHWDRSLVRAAICYAVLESGKTDAPLSGIQNLAIAVNSVDPIRDLWPWGEEWWKPSDPIRNLEKAGALIAAELDRLLRAKAQKTA